MVPAKSVSTLHHAGLPTEMIADHNRKLGLRLYFLNWTPLGFVALLLSFCLAGSSFSLEIEGSLLTVVFIATSFTVAGHSLLLWEWGSRPAFALLSVAQLQVLFLIASPLTFVAASANLPLVDANLAYWDQLFGLDWRAYYNFVTKRPTLLQYTVLFYAMITWPSMGVPIILGFTRNCVRLQQFTMACILTVCVTIVVSSLVSALGTYQQYSLPTNFSEFNAPGYLVQMDRLPLARDGTLRALNLGRLGGI